MTAEALSTILFLQQFEERRLARAQVIYRMFFGWLALPLIIMGLALAFVYMVIVCHAIKSRHVNRKYYVLLVNRAVGDILFCISALVTSCYVLSVEHISECFVGIAEFVCGGAGWSAAISYVSLSVIKFYSVWKPLRSRSLINTKRCIYLAILSWIIFALTLAYAMVVLALVKVPALNKWSGCKVETCFRMMLFSKYCAGVVIYFFTLSIFAITVVLIKRAREHSSHLKPKQCSENEKRTRFPLWKLALNVATFVTLSFPYILWCTVLLMHPDKCFWLQNFVELLKFFGIIRFFLFFRIFIDPTISFIIDYQV
ncbi:unnamed protein product [Toxocara canis]|uniref:G_PROTEIN_RECEP_F1_2 domain-containing protein n=1 Tax=Toxocara canis TaxID=6265 RepID=A0A183UC53_TOXCA|nr:unnamed protein product [Toxocara canis]